LYKSFTSWEAQEITPLFAYNNNNNQAFYSQASWGRLEMKPHKQKKNRYKTKAKKKEKTKSDKKSNQKRRKCNKTLSQKSEKGVEKIDKRQ
jgi:hypothetical protein